MATQAIAGAVDKVLSAVVPGLLKDVGMQVYNGHPFWNKIAKTNRRSWEGDSIQGAIVSSTYAKAASYQNDDTVDTSVREPFTAFQYELGGYQTNVNIPGMKIRKVQSSSKAVFRLASDEVKLAMIDMMDLLSTHLLQASNDAKGIYSLDTLTDATTTIAGVAGSSTWGGTTTASGSFAGQGKADMTTLWSTLSVYTTFDDNDNNKTGFQMEPDIVLTNRTIWQSYWNSLESSMRYAPGDTGDVLNKLAFMGIPITVDQHVATGRLYMLKSSSMYLYTMPDADFTMLPVIHPSTQPDMWSRACIWNGQLVINSRRFNGKLTGITA